ncbi:MAG: hypothetical protein R2879_20445 [Saprospiraceae bacterium]
MRLLLLCSFLFLALFSNAQTKSVSIPLEENEIIIDEYPVNENGFFITSGIQKWQETNPVYKFTYLNQDLEKVWEVEQERKEKSIKFSNSLVTTPGNAYIYHLEGIGFFSVASYNVTQIDGEGKTKNFSIQVADEPFRIVARFADDEHFFLLKRMEDLSFVLHSYKHTTLKEKPIKIQLPEIIQKKGEEDFYSWKYEGQKDGLFYFSLKNVDVELNKVTYKIAKINADGSLQKEFSVDLKPNEGEFLKHTHGNSTPHLGFYSTDGARESPKKEIKYIGNIYFDLKNDRFFVFGLTGNKPFKKNWRVDGILNTIFDLDGKEQKRTSILMPEELIGAVRWKIGTESQERRLRFMVFPDKTFYFSLFWLNTLYNMKFDAKGNYDSYQICETGRNTGPLTIQSCRAEFKNERPFKFFSNRYENEKYEDSLYTLFNWTGRDFVIETNRNKTNFQIHLFK